jgi:hypothetical protein
MPVMLGLPVYGGQCHFTCARGLADFAMIAGRHGLEIDAFWLANESSIGRGRNTCAAHFMATDCSNLMFIDSDIGFDGRDVMELLALQAATPRYDIIGGRYPKKNLSGHMVVNYGPTGTEPPTFDEDTRDPQPVFAIGTGFMLIRRRVFEALAPWLPKYPCEIGSGTEMTDYFTCGIDPITERYLTEDYMFCARAARIGITTWLCPWIKLSHAGLYVFE